MGKTIQLSSKNRQCTQDQSNMMQQLLLTRCCVQTRSERHNTTVQYLLHFIFFFIFLFLSKCIGNDLDIEMSVLLLYHKYFLIIIILTIILPHLSGHLDDNTQAVGSKFPLSCLQNSRKVIWI